MKIRISCINDTLSHNYWKKGTLGTLLFSFIITRDSHFPVFVTNLQFLLPPYFLSRAAFLNASVRWTGGPFLWMKLSSPTALISSPLSHMILVQYMFKLIQKMSVTTVLIEEQVKQSLFEHHVLTLNLVSLLKSIGGLLQHLF